jgi:hypothetical protein
MIKVIHIEPREGSRLAVVFSDDTQGVAELSDLIARPGAMVEPLRDPAYFARVFIEAGAPTWPNGFDLAPWALHDRLKAEGRLQPVGDAA